MKKDGNAILCTSRCANGLTCFISVQKTVKGPTTHTQSAQTDKRKIFFLLELLELEAIIGAFLFHRKDLMAESYENKQKNT